MVTTVCRFCPAGCGMNVYVEGNRAYKVEGLAEDPRTKGILCPKGKAALEVLYSSERILYPLRRKGDKGGGKWEVVNWDVALDDVASKFRNIIKGYGAKAISVYRGQASDWGASWLYALRFMNALGSPNITTPSHLCYTPRTMAHSLTYGGMVEPDFENTRCLVVWGANPTETNERAPFARQIFEAQARGAKLIVIDPILTRLAENADIWLQVRPGADCALALAMLHVIVKEELYDKDFICEWTVGFDALSRHLKNYSPEQMAETTGVSPDLIREAARLFATTKPSCIFEGNGLDQHLNVVQTVRAICLLRAVTGNIEVKGGDVFPDTLSRGARDIKLLERLPRDVSPVGGYSFYFDLTRVVPPPPVIDAIITGKPYPIKAMIVQGGNPVVTLANSRKTEEALRRLDFLVVMDMFMTRTAQLADLILPAATFLETTNLNAYPGMRTNYPLLQQKVVEPLGQAWPDWKLWFELAKRLGLEEDFSWHDVDAAIDYQLEPTGFRAEHLKGRVVVIPKRYGKFRETGFFTPSKKVELFSSTMAAYGFDPLPRHIDPAEYLPDYAEVSQKYPLLGLNWPRTVFYSHTQFRHILSLRLADPEPLVFLHHRDAAERGIADGDAVVVRSPLGSVVLKAALTDRLLPGTVGLTWGWGEAIPGAGTNELVDDLARDPICGATSNRLFLCEVEKAEST